MGCRTSSIDREKGLHPESGDNPLPMVTDSSPLAQNDRGEVMERRRVYLDHTATTPLAPGVFEAMQPYLTEKWLSPGGLYRGARALRRELEDARRRVAQLIGAE